MAAINWGTIHFYSAIDSLSVNHFTDHFFQHFYPYYHKKGIRSPFKYKRSLSLFFNTYRDQIQILLALIL